MPRPWSRTNVASRTWQDRLCQTEQSNSNSRSGSMAINACENIWCNGNLIPWDDAKLHVMSHVINYGSAVFEGLRCYQTPKGPAVFRLPDHMQRLLDSAKVYRMEVDYSLDDLVRATVELIAANKVSPCYVRPIILRGYGTVGVDPTGSPIDVYIVNYE